MILLQVGKSLSFGILALFTSISTLLCCALPIVLVGFGVGSVVATVTLQLPFLVTLSYYKPVLFGTSAGLLGLSAWFIWRKQECSVDPMLAARCQKINGIEKKVFWTALFLWMIGLIASYLLLPLRQLFNV